MTNTMKQLEHEILLIAGGEDEYGYPNAASGIIIDNGIHNTDYFLPAPVEMFSSDKAITCIFEFHKNQSDIYVKAKDVCLSWLLGSDEENLILSVCPLLLDAECSIFCTNLYFVDFYECNNGKKRLILCFGSFHILPQERVDMDAFENEVHKEYQDILKSYDEKIAEMDKKIEEMEEEEDPFAYRPDINDEKEETNIEDPDHNRVRFVQENKEDEI